MTAAGEAPAKRRPALVYKPDYEVDFRDHVFPVDKYRQTYERVVTSGLTEHVELVEPENATRADLLLVHHPGYVADFMCSAHSPRMLSSELPVAEDIRDFFLMTTGASIAAVREAAAGGIGINLGGGFHHAFPGHAEGFCYINDIGVGIRRAKKDGLLRRVLVVDCDVHQGNGTAVIFAEDPDVFTFSIHQEHNYPLKQKSDLDIGLDDFAGDDEYLGHLTRTVPSLLDGHAPELVFYVAGADAYKDDQLGGLSLTKAGLAERDKIVIGEARRRGVPVAIAFAGGYAINPADVPDIHFATCRIAIELG
ncbi:MAG: histone deacetylase [Actinobacteria bacterium]|nr:MAG: histone deacetylase [Actinomycetota bacterium]